MTKNFKIILFIFSFFILGTLSVLATDIIGSAPVTITSYTVTASAGAGGAITPASQSVNHNNTTTFTVAPNVGYSSSVGGTCGGSLVGTTYTTNAITANCTVVASFTITTNNLTIVSPGGISGTYTAPGTYAVNYQASPVVTAEGWAGYSASISGGCTAGPGAVGASVSCTVAFMASAQTVTVTYTVVPYLLTVAKAGTGAGTVTGTGISCGADCTESINYGNSVTLTATPSTGSTFTSWSGGGCSGTGTCTVTVTAATTVTATFTLIPYTLTIPVSGGTGSGTYGGTAAGAINYGTAVSVTAAPSAGSTFTKWVASGAALACNNQTTSPCAFTMTSAASVQATYAMNIPSAPTSLNVTPSTCNNNWLNLSWTESATATSYQVFRGATPVTLSSYSCASGTCSGSDTGLTLSTLYSYTVYASNAGGQSAASATVSSTTANACGPTPDIKVTAWSGTNSDGPIETYTGDAITLSWAAVANAVSCTLSGGTLTAGAVTTGAGSQATTASALSQTYTLSCTNSTGQVGSNSVTVTTPPPPTGLGYSCSGDSLTANVSWTAPGGYNTFYIRTNLAGVSTGLPGYNDNHVGTTVAIPVSPNTTYDYWMHTRSSNGSWSTAPGLSINCARTHTLNIVSPGAISGTYTAPGTYTLNYGATPTVTAGGWAGYTASISGGCTAGPGALGANVSCTLPAITTNQTVTVTYSISSNILTVSKAGTGTGTVTSAPAGISCGATCAYSYNYGTSVTLTAAPSSNSVFAGWSGGGCSGTGTCVTTVNSATTVTATFSLMTGTISASPTSCIIAANASTCTTNPTLTWSITNPIGTPTAITASGMTNINVTATLVSPQNGTHNISNTVPYGGRTFYLYNNSINLVPAGVAVTASCASGSIWNVTDQLCRTPSGNISVNSCNIALGASNCSVTLDWSTLNPVGVSEVTTPTSILVATGNSDETLVSGSKTYTMLFGAARTFYLYNNNILKSQATSAAPACATGAWNGTICAQNNLTIVSPGAILSPDYTAPGTYAVNYGASPVVTAGGWAGYSASISGGCTAGPGAVGANVSCTVTNMIAAQTVTVTYGDGVAPTTPGIMTTSWTRDHFVNTSFTAATTGATDSGSGIRGYRLCRSLDNASGCSVWTAAGEHAGTTEVVSGTDLPTNGTFRYYYWYAYDNSGNQSNPSTGEYIRMDSSAPDYNQTTFTGCNYESGNNCYVKNGTTFYTNVNHSDSGVGTSTQYMEFSKDGLNRGTWDGLTGNIKSYADPYGVANGSLYGSYGEGGGMNGVGFLDIQDVTCAQTTNCNSTALGSWRAIAGSGASGMYGVTVYMYDGFGHGVGYTATTKYVYLDNTAPTIPAPTDDGANAAPSLNFYGTPSDSSSGLAQCYAQIDINNADGLSLAMATTAVGVDGDHTWTGVAGNTYYYRYYCDDNVGNSSAWSSWTDGVAVNSAPTVTTPTCTPSSTTATLGANVTSLGVPATISARGTCWGTAASPTTNCLADGATTTGVFTQARTGFSPGTLYYYRGYATNTTGTAYSPDGTCTTLAVLPTITTTTPVTSIVQTTATGGGNVSSNGGATVTASGLVWNTSTNPTTALATKTTDGWALGGPWTSGMTGLTPGTLYYVRAYATNSAGTAYGANVTFTTLGVPTVTSPTGTSPAQTTATLGANVTSLGNPASISARGTCWALTASPTTNCLADGATTTGVFTQARTGLACGTTYYYRGYATNTTGTGYSADGTFTTTVCNSVPIVTTPTVTAVTSITATLGANVTSLGVPATISARGTCWGTAAAPTTNCLANGTTTTGIFTQARTGFTSGITYYYRGYATNTTGTGYSADGTFTTLAPSGTLTSNASSCTIAANASSCTTSPTITWSTTNPIGTSAVTASGMTTVNGDSGSQAMAVPYGGRTFFLYNNAIELAQTTVTASCAAGAWNGTVCGQYTVTATNPANGVVTAPLSKAVNYNATTTFTITPNAGYTASVSGCSGTLNGDTYTTGAITASCTVTVSYSLSSYTLNYSAGAGGTISGTLSQAVNYGSNGTIVTAVPNTGYNFTGWSEGGLHKFTRGSSTFTVPAGVTSVESLVVAGGGGGGGSTAGGGGAGGVIYNANYSVTSGGTVAVTVGNGGLGSIRSDQGVANNTNGGNSIFGTLTAIGGGYGFSGYTSGSRVASSGGSGGGAGYYSGNNIGVSTPGAGTAGQGNSGGTVSVTTNWGGAGGGGAGGVGNTNGAPSSTRNGGIGVQYDISGILTYYGGGGGGGVFESEAASPGGLGGGGNGGSGIATIAQAGTANTGGGGGGGGYYQYGPGGGAGGSGVVIVKYPITTAARQDTSVTLSKSPVASFAINTYTVTASAGANGTITAPLIKSINHGSTTTYTITPNSGYVTSVGGTCGGSLVGTTYTTNAITANCTVVASFPQMTGTLTSNASSCTIALNASTCTTNPTLTWATTNPVSTSAVTAALVGSNPAVNVAGNSGSQSTLFVVPYPSRTFFLYNNGIELAQTTVTTTCATGAWNGSICAQNNLTIVSSGAISGTYTAPGTYAVNYGASPVVTAGGWAGYTASISGGCTAGPGALGANVTCTVSNMITAQTVTVTYSISSNALTVSKIGTGTGTVTSSPAGISCGATCAYSYSYGTSVTLTAVPSSNSVFAGWSGGGCSGTGTCVTTVNSATTVTATFSLMTGTLTSNVSSCTIALGASTCTTNPTLTWATTNPVSTSAVTAALVGANPAVNVAGNSGSQSTSFVVPYSSRTFFLYNNAIELAQTTITASCISGAWNGTICATPPTVTTPTATAISFTTATLGANVTSLGSPASISASGTCWGTSANPTTNCLASGTTTTGIFTQARTGFSPSTLYYYRGYAINATGTGYSADGTFTTSSVTVSVTATTAYSVTTPTSNVNLAYTPTTNTGTTQCQLLDNASVLIAGYDYPQANPIAFTGIPSTPGTYGYYIRCRNTTYTTVTGTSPLIVITVNGVPTVTSPTATSISGSSATLGANVTSLGYPASISARGTCWGTVANPTTNCLAQGGTTTGIFTQARTGFSPNTTYYYRGYATNATGTAYSTDGTFITATVPSVTTTTPVTSITQSTATGGGNVTSDGRDTVTVSGLVWSTSVNPTTALATKTTDGWAAPGVWTSSITGLSCGNLYHVRAYATNSVGTSYGADVTFTTSACLSANVTTQTPIINITGTTATGGGTIVDNGGVAITVSGLVWSTSVNPTTTLETKTTDGWAVGGPWTSEMTGLEGNTLYNVRAYATNSVGTSYGANVTFTTFAVPTVTSPTVSALTETTATLNANVTSAGNPTTLTARGFCYGTTPNTVTNCVETSSKIVTVYVNGGGGGGGGISVSGGGGGGGGGAASNGDYSVINSNYTVTVGAGGTAGASASGNGGNGGDSWFNSVSTIFAKGGNGGIGGLSGAGGTGGQSSLGFGTLKYSGGNGVAGNTTYSGGGGGGAGSTGNGGDATTLVAGTGTTLYGGNGGVRRTANGAGLVGVVAGGGGSGGFRTSAASRAGGAGAAGRVVIKYLTGGGTFTGGSITTVGAETFHTFTTSGTFAVSGLISEAPVLTTGAYTRGLVELTPGTTYYYRGYADNAFGRGYSSEGTFVPSSVTVSVTATTPISADIGYDIPFVYNPTTNSGTVECHVLDNSSASLTSYPSTSIAAPVAAPGAFGYYIECRNNPETTITTKSNLITVNTACAINTSWNGSICMGTTGSLTASNCNIANNANSCTTNLSWSTTNPVGTSSVTTPTGITVATDNTSSTTYPVSFGTRDFYLYNNGSELANATAQAICTVGTNVWNGTNCVPPTGTISANGCTIALNAGGCNTTLDWTTTNPLTGFTSIVKNVTNNINVETTLNTGTKVYSLTPVNKTFALIHNGVTLSSVSPLAVCAQDTNWNGATCVIDAPDDTPGGNTIFTVNEQSPTATIFKGRTATVAWNSSVATSCSLTSSATAFAPAETLSSGPISGTTQVSPLDTTIYTLTCANATSPGGIPFEVTTKVITLEIKEN